MVSPTGELPRRSMDLLSTVAAIMETGCLLIEGIVEASVVEAEVGRRTYSGRGILGVLWRSAVGALLGLPDFVQEF